MASKKMGSNLSNSTIKRLFASFFIVLMLLCMVSVFSNFTGIKAAVPITVGKTPGVTYDFSSIQAAINHAQAGDTINVDAGTYTENLVIDKPINLVSLSTAVTVDGGGTATTITVTANDVTISGFKITNGGGSSSGGVIGLGGTPSDPTLGNGVFLEGSGARITGNVITENQNAGLEVTGSNEVITDNEVRNQAAGIEVESNGNTITDNTFSDCDSVLMVIGSDNEVSGNSAVNGGSGIYVSGDFNTVKDNNVQGNGSPMYLTGAHLLVDNNQIMGTTYGLGMALESVKQSSVSNNEIWATDTSLGGMSLENCQQNVFSNNHIFSNMFGLTLTSCNNNIFDSLTISDNKYNGIELRDSNNNQFIGCTVKNNGLNYNPDLVDNRFSGFFLDSSTSNSILNCEITENHYCGVYAQAGSDNNIVKSSTIQGNGYGGIYITGSDGNQIASDKILENYVGVEFYNQANHNRIVSCSISYNNGEGAFGVYITEGCYDDKVQMSYISHNFYGVYLLDNVNSTDIQANSISDNSNAGITLQTYSGRTSCYENLVHNNTIAGNQVTGVYINGWKQDSADKNVLCDNTIINNKFAGLSITYSSQNRIYQNNFINNGVDGKCNQAYDQNTAGNFWDSNSPTAPGGNYWSDHVGTDDNHDGFIDSSYAIVSLAMDRYPLVSPTETISSTVSQSVPLGENTEIGDSGVSVNVPGSSGSVDVSATEYSGYQPSGTNINTGGTYYDVKVTGSLAGDTLVTVTISDAGITSTSKIMYWDDKAHTWQDAVNQVFIPEYTLQGDIPAYALTGTPLLVATPTNLTVNCNPVTITSGITNTLISGTLSMTSDHTAVSSQSILLSYSTDGNVWEDITSASTTADGSYTYTWDVTSLTAGIYLVKAELSPNDQYTANPAVTGTEGNGESLIVAPLSTALTVIGNPSVIDKTAGVTSTDIIGKLALASDFTEGIANKHVTVSYSADGEDWTEIGTVLTASDGSYTCTWNVATMPNGQYNVKVQFSGDDVYSASDAFTGTEGNGEPISIVPVPTELTITLSPRALNKETGEMDTMISGTLTLASNLNAGIGGKTITLSYSLDGSTWQTLGTLTPTIVHTQSSGMYQYHWTVTSDVPNGEYMVKAEFAGDNTYQGKYAITPSGSTLFITPEYAFGALLAVLACFAAFVALRMKPSLNLKPNKL